MQFLKDFFNDLDGRQRLFAFVFVGALSALLLALWTKGIVATICITGALLALFVITRPIWLPPNHGNTLVRRISLFIVYGTAVSFSLWSTLIYEGVLKAVWPPLKQAIPRLPENPPEDVGSISAMLFVLAGVFIVNFLMRDRSGMGQHPKSLESEFPEPAYRERLNNFCKLLRDELDKIDRETSWSEHFFTPLDAEVSVQRDGRRYHRVTDLLNAIKRNRQTQAFLVLGDPGSGKSVALRKLARDLLNEVGSTGKVPLYVNLREWNCPTHFSHENLPEVQSIVTALNDFVLANVRGRLDLFGNRFVEKYWQQMFEQGRLFFILDSFDEISVLLDVDERSPLIDRLSDGVYRFVAGAHQSRGILASRLFRRPTNAYKAAAVLEIRPLSDQKILEFVEKRLLSKEKITAELFTRRPDLIAVARNPFTAALLLQYIEDRIPSGEAVVLPDTRAELYRSYIHSRLEESTDVLNKAGMTISETFEIATSLATLMFDEPRFGFEAPLKELEQRTTSQNLRKGLDVLKFSRLIRIGAGTERVSFVHRRFAEFFAAQRLITEPKRLPHQAIPSDSRWRDALVLFCEVADSESAKAVAAFCWNRISDYSRKGAAASATERLEAVYCLRFLTEAFKTKQKAVTDFQAGLAEFVRAALQPDNKDLLSMKIAVEAVGLLPEADLSPTLIAALKTRNQWICEIAFRACRYLPSVDEKLLKAVHLHLDKVSPLEVIQRRREYTIAFSLANGLRPLHNAFRGRLVDALVFTMGTVSFFLLQPLLFLWGLLMVGSGSMGAIFGGHDTSFLTVRNRVRACVFLSVVVLPQLISPGVFVKQILALIPPVFASPSESPSKSPVTTLFLNGVSPFWSALVNQLGLVGAVSVLGLITVFIFPTIPVVSRLQNSVGLFSTIWRAVSRFCLPFLQTIVIGGAALWLLGYWLKEKLMWVIITLVGICVLVSFFVTFALLKDFMKDISLLRGINLTGQQSRRVVHDHFTAFKTGFWRYRFIKKIEEQKLKPTGEWPVGHAPNVANDAASTLLAQLDESWSMLDR